MYCLRQLLSFTYEEMRKEVSDVEAFSTARKSIIIRSKGIDSFGDDSDIVVCYDLLDDSVPLLLVERINKKDISLRKLKRRVRRLQSDFEDYIVEVVTTNSPLYYDVLVLKKNIYNRLK